ncbi:hypothetical protein VOLCADRAFT_106850 [Volvox carteri f. nagariensis]|uniref:Uncharacterized protein n=1 Tax=Volvox carteri f. nagariensis TaxID=3068 RepID=D8UA50_VOLCA|nr:uncharacterized protein VOLCADRAFT_106850 [Volvox carteri f. nagariensis]EFJ43413.1 hypothetical protein VOLCADRAFT_106850 [Volvox carteri f. nagariensis]|eukprot:XP_002955560.1 hypothetical protein VOLCADRAFT_106850 [Volvox carteri f. nagariensis]
MPAGSSQPIAIKGSMPSKATRESRDAVPAGSLEEALVNLKLSTKDPEQTRRLDHALHVLSDVVSGPNICCEDHEALWWEIFAEVFVTEVAAQTHAAGGREPSSSCKRQILADILVWAEVTQDHYDSGTQRFVTEPHEADESFQRIGRTFRALKARRGLGKSRASSSDLSGDGDGINAGALCVSRLSSGADVDDTTRSDSSSDLR